MMIRLALAPFWVRLLANIAIGWVMASLALVFWTPGDPSPPRGQVGWWVVVGIVGFAFGVFIAVMAQIQGAPWRAALNDVPPQERQRIAKALTRGPLPTEPVARSALIRLADGYLARAAQLPRGYGKFVLGLLCFWCLLAVVQSLSLHPNPEIVAMNMPVWGCVAIQLYYVVPLVEARRALMLNAEGM
ncbi:hypothetical protein FZI91_11125 [Mycobacterium sp. CBMA271]|uniref:hypothetical protein n=1 Tax=unclassified Mycobacteroides TaxID=2618759 RepID=UPI0012DBE5AD|nr:MULTISPECIES: hypothetical protein [unclassified Mycobacteroides]MUM16245.1 hypothetical protein [Mycobacteroides sp. CBMA 326]MUM22252.1 hypothetical protein [Mycobacteroides sp. CBMA 271]